MSYTSSFLSFGTDQRVNVGTIHISNFETTDTRILYNVLKAIVYNGDGYISAKELGVLMRTMGRNPTEDEILNMMNEIDIDHNGKLDFAEFTIMMHERLRGDDMEQEIKQAFRVFDRNGDGFISKSEFKHCMMHFGERFTDDEVEEMISEADSNNDGKIDYTEFSQMILKELNMDNASNSVSSTSKGLKKHSI
ncbi:CALM [Lepeophtheirus salmonis]|uniref:CALM n=1 Tax=Lepeophtheirus salmonis TaxID=72036 RepID=A0A7R8CJR6_LEPSM|nr:CALM [Lepeophtheirus salmonis]CAF2844214.1 CALM [Lepeophtheirus salmonis]